MTRLCQFGPVLLEGELDMGRMHIRQPAEAGAALVCAAYAILLAGLYQAGAWLVRADGSLMTIDFLPLYAAGRLALDGEAAAAYQWHVLHAMQAALGGGAYGGWLNPPFFLFVFAPLASLPYVSAYLIWLLGSVAVFIIGMRSIATRAWLFGLAAPATFLCAWNGQSGILTAGLIALWLSQIDRRPTLAGSALGVMTYKPHLGFVFPLLLLVSRRWRTFWAATAMTLALVSASAAIFGLDAWVAFLRSIAGTSAAYLGEEGETLQTTYGAARTMTGSLAVAAAAHVAVAGISIALAIRLWAGRFPLEIRAASALSAGFLATPYSFIYDATVLVVAAAFLMRAQVRGIDRWTVIAAVLLPAASLAVRSEFIAPIGWMLILAVSVRLAGRSAGGRSPGILALPCQVRENAPGPKHSVTRARLVAWRRPSIGGRPGKP